MSRPDTPPAAPPPPLPAGHRGILWGVSFLFSLWVLALTALVITTANPPQINWVQMSRARVLVTVRVEDTRTCHVERRFTPRQVPETIHVTNLPDTPARIGKTYLLPLVEDIAGKDGSYRIVTIPERAIGPLIYPESPDLITQLEAWQRGPR